MIILENNNEDKIRIKDKYFIFALIFFDKIMGIITIMQEIFHN